MSFAITSPHFSGNLQVLWPRRLSHTHTAKPQSPISLSSIDLLCSLLKKNPQPCYVVSLPYPRSLTSPGPSQGLADNPSQRSPLLPTQTLPQTLSILFRLFPTFLFYHYHRRSSLEKSKADHKPSPSPKKATTISSIFSLKLQSFHPSSSSFPYRSKSTHQPSPCLQALSSQASLGTTHFFTVLCGQVFPFTIRLPERIVIPPTSHLLTSQSIPDPRSLSLNWKGSAQGWMTSWLLNPTVMAISLMP